MVKKAIMQERNSQFDQEAVLHLLREEKEKNQLNFFFCEYKTASNKLTSSDKADNSDGSTSSSQTDNLDKGGIIGKRDSLLLLGENCKSIEPNESSEAKTHEEQ